MDIIDNVSNEERFLMAVSNPAVFGEYYIKPFTKGWDTKTANFQFDMIENVLTYQNIVVHIPVEHAKSTWISLVYPLWLLARDKNISIAIISNTARQAKGFMSVIKQHLETNELIHRDFPYLIPDYDYKWTETEIFLKRDITKKSKDPSILALGTEGAILGARLDYVIGDDICDLQNTATELSRQKVLTWWNEIIDSRVSKTGKKILLGTLQHNQDLLCTLSDKKSYHYVHYAGLDETTNPPTPLWGDKWSLERLLQKKEDIGSISFARVIQNDREQKFNKLLDINWLNYYGGHRTKQLPPIYELDYYISFDPAIADDRDTGIKNKLDRACIAVTALSKKTKDIFLIEYYQDWLTFPEQVKLIDQYWDKYNKVCRGIGIESVAYQKALAQQAYLLKSLPPVIAVKVGTQSKATRLVSFSVYAESGRYFILDTHNDFIEEWKNFEPGGASPNVLDACSVGVIMMTQGGKLTKEQKEKVQSISI